MDPADLLSQQNEILAACTQPSFVQLTWAPGYRDNDNNLRKEICHSIENYWSLHARQLSRHLNVLRVELRTSVNRMRTSPEAWTRSQHTASNRVNSHTEELKMAISSFISAIADMSPDTLRIGRTRSSTSQEVPEDLDSELRSAM